jgi:hypothetical protein
MRFVLSEGEAAVMAAFPLCLCSLSLVHQQNAVQAPRMIEEVAKNYISADVNDMDLFNRWGAGIKKMVENNSVESVEDTFEQVREEIVSRATQSLRAS